uniref:Cytochrome P450 33C4 n=2 Tax=Bursaphelenchus xylophilus TaxID=6326 RepID=A0A0B5JJZ6_BURXY|nr:cytochrome P450 33C4 [Bursaphelenchus xylophilus]
MVEYFQKQGDKFEDRPPDAELMRYSKGIHYGIINNNGDLWKSQRRFALQVLRDFGLGKDLMEQRVLAECEDLVRNLEEDAAGGVEEHSITCEVDIAIGSVINSVLFGYRYNKENVEEFEDLKRRAFIFLQVLGYPTVMVCRLNPNFYEKIPILGRYVKQSREVGHHLMDFFAQRVKQHMKDLESEDMESLEVTDMVAAFLKEKANLDRLNQPHYFTLEQLYGFCFDIWIAGQETTSNTIGWGLAYLIMNPQVQRKIHEELDRVVGSERMITIADRANLNYLHATCLEIHRIANLLPSNIPHAVTEDLNFEGYFLPKETAIVPLISVVLYDSNIFPEPYRFNPERFLDEDGNVRKIKEFAPFSIGKRVCLGENLARMEVFLVIANLMNRLELLPGKEEPDFTRSHAITSHIKDFKCRVLPRFR